MSGKKRSKIFETKVFAFIIGAIIFVLMMVLSQFTAVFTSIENSMLDVYFNYRNLRQGRNIQEGVSYREHNPQISPDILIVGIDFKALDRFGKWPFPRWREADLIKSFSRIRNQNERERSLFLDVFFIEPDKDAIYDGMVVEAMKESGRVFLETVLDEVPPPAASGEEYFERQQALYDSGGELLNIKGDWREMPAFYGLQPPLKPYARAAYGYGHANFNKDRDGIYRRQALVAKSSVLVNTLRLDELTPAYPVDHDAYQRLAWEDKDGLIRNVEHPLTAESLKRLKDVMAEEAPLKSVDEDNDGSPDDSFYVVKHYQDHFVPAITLALALDYFNKNLEDIEVVLGDHITIDEPEIYDVESRSWKPYTIIEKYPVYDEDNNLIEEGESREISRIRIPIDENGKMVINFMGPPSFASAGKWQTYPVRSFYGYAARPPAEDPRRWPPTKAVENKIVMMGPFAKGMAADEKTTPYGLMYGVEIHANALNTILMDNFITDSPLWIDTLLLLVVIMLVALMTSRMATFSSAFLSLVMILALFLAGSIIFDLESYVIDFPPPAFGIVFTLVSIIAYRAMTEEKDKKKIRNMFGTYLSPRVVDQIIDEPPELGGLDKNLTVFFSDIRGFTTLSESMTPQELVSLLNRYLSKMTDIILDTEGTLDKYEGDAIMAFWGAPLPQDDHALRACRAAVRQMEALTELNKELPEEKQINIGIGLNSGIMTVGNMGSSQRMDYTLIGDNVNLGARLEGTNKQYGTNIIISEYTYEAVKDSVVARELDNIRVKGKNKPVLIYELLDIVEEETEKEQG